MRIARHSELKRAVVLLAFALCGFLPGAADEDASRFKEQPGMRERDSFTFARIQYDSAGGNGEAWYSFEGRIWQRWETDYPRAELNLLQRLKELTSLNVIEEPVVLRLEDERLFDFPFIFMSDVGWQVLSTAEGQRLKQYLEQGGFLWVDDFWGEAEWRNFELNIRAAAPEWKWRRIPTDHAILSNVYPLDGCPQIPARHFFSMTGRSQDPHWIHRQPSGGESYFRQVNFMGLFDTNDRLLAVATHNTDVADGWEREGESREFFEIFSTKAYAIGVNIIVYAMTH